MASAVDPLCRARLLLLPLLCARLAAVGAGLSTRKVKPSPRIGIRGQGSECSTVAFSPDGSKWRRRMATGP